MYLSFCIGYIFFYVQYMMYALWGLVIKKKQKHLCAIPFNPNW